MRSSAYSLPLEGNKMTRQNRNGMVLSGLFMCLVALGVSDTVRAQTVTLSGVNVSNNVLAFPNVTAGSLSAVQVVHVSTSSDPSTVIVQVNTANPWIQVSPAGSVNTSIS